MLTGRGFEECFRGPERVIQRSVKGLSGPGVFEGFEGNLEEDSQGSSRGL